MSTFNSAKFTSANSAPKNKKIHIRRRDEHSIGTRHSFLNHEPTWKQFYDLFRSVDYSHIRSASSGFDVSFLCLYSEVSTFPSNFHRSHLPTKLMIIRRRLRNFMKSFAFATNLVPRSATFQMASENEKKTPADRSIKKDKLIFANFPMLLGRRFDTAANAFDESESAITFRGGMSRMYCTSGRPTDQPSTDAHPV